MRPIPFEFNGKVYYGYAEKVNGELWFHIGGKTFSMKAEGSEYEAGHAGAEADPSQIVAPMPGKIMKVSRKVGDKVKEGDAIVSMEAMKMEYVLKAAASAKIKAISCKEGEQVTLGQQLVELEVNDG